MVSKTAETISESSSKVYRWLRYPKTTGLCGFYIPPFLNQHSLGVVLCHPPKQQQQKHLTGYLDRCCGPLRFQIRSSAEEQEPLVASLLLVAMPGAPYSSLLPVAMPFAPSSFLLLVVRPGAPSSDAEELSVCLFHAKFGGPCLPVDFENIRPSRLGEVFGSKQVGFCRAEKPSHITFFFTVCSLFGFVSPPKFAFSFFQSDHILAAAWSFETPPKLGFERGAFGSACDACHAFAARILNGWVDELDRPVYAKAKEIFEQDLLKFGISHETCRLGRRATETSQEGVFRKMSGSVEEMVWYRGLIFYNM